MFKTKTEYAYEMLKEDIIGGRYYPEERLKPDRLSKDIAVSTVPVREALVQLEKDRFLVQVPHQGYSVAPMAISEFEELVALRQALEEIVIPLVFDNITVQQLEHLANLVKRMRSYFDQEEPSEGERNNHAAFVALNREFHVGIAKASGFTHLPPILGNILDLSQRYINTIEIRYGIRHVDIEDHEAILDAIKAKETATLKKIYEQHYKRVLDEFRSYMAEHGVETFYHRKGDTDE